MRQSDNHFDSNAIAVMLGSHHVGYFSRQDAEKYAPVFDAGGIKKLEAKLLSVDEKYPRFSFKVPAKYLYDEFKA